MCREFELTIGFALVIAMGCGVSNAAAQTDKYPRISHTCRQVDSREQRDRS